jgi:tetratricopeptide (TPR) repeat protein
MRGGYEMKYKSIIFISFLLSLIGLMCLFVSTEKEVFPVLTWDRTYGGSNFDWAESLIQTSDGGYAVAGITSSKGAEDFNLGELKRYEEAIEAYEKAIELNPKEALVYSNLGELYLDIGNLEDASKKAKDALERNKNLVSALTLQGRINIEEKNYDTASKSFKRAISLDINNPKHFLWEAYASYLKAKFSFGLKSEKYQEELIGIIRNLERANLITEKHGEEMKPYILYFLACFYLKSEDAFTAKEKLEECIRLKSKSLIEKLALKLLNNIWNYKIRPPWWRWWLCSPLCTWPKRIGFFILTSFILVFLALLLFHPFISWWFFPLQINWTLYGFLITILIIILISPSIEHIRVRDFEVAMYSPPPFEPVLSPMVMEEKIKEIEKNIRNWNH